jgi:hypothetical protein
LSSATRRSAIWAPSGAAKDADAFEDLPGKRQAAILKAEENRPNLRVAGSD